MAKKILCVIIAAAATVALCYVLYLLGIAERGYTAVGGEYLLMAMVVIGAVVICTRVCRGEYKDRY